MTLLHVGSCAFQRVQLCQTRRVSRVSSMQWKVSGLQTKSVPLRSHPPTGVVLFKHHDPLQFDLEQLQDLVGV